MKHPAQRGQEDPWTLCILGPGPDADFREHSHPTSQSSSPPLPCHFEGWEPLGVCVCERVRDADVTIITVKPRTDGSRRFSRRNLFPGKLKSRLPVQP